MGETSSTNADLLATARERADRQVLVAEQQTSGRGRLDRVWTSPPRAGLLFSMLVRPRAPIAEWGWLPLLTGVALAEAVQDVAGLACALKWPNDLLLGEQRRKAAGILVQSTEDAVVIGIGLNVSTTLDELPVPTRNVPGGRRGRHGAGSVTYRRARLGRHVARDVRGRRRSFHRAPPPPTDACPRPWANGCG